METSAKTKNLKWIRGTKRQRTSGTLNLAQNAPLLQRDQEAVVDGYNAMKDVEEAAEANEIAELQARIGMIRSVQKEWKERKAKALIAQLKRKLEEANK